MHAIDPAATAWLLASTALVLLMTPGLAIFYGGMVRTTGVLNMIMMSFISIPLVTVAWLLVGYSIAFSDDAAGDEPDLLEDAPEDFARTAIDLADNEGDDDDEYGQWSELAIDYQCWGRKVPAVNVQGSGSRLNET